MSESALKKEIGAIPHHPLDSSPITDHPSRPLNHGSPSGSSAPNIVWHHATVTRKRREDQNGHQRLGKVKLRDV